MPPPIGSFSRALVRLLSGRRRALDCIGGTGLPSTAQTRCFSSLARIGSPCIREFFGEESCRSIGNWHRNAQARSFLGCGDGEEGSVLSKIYEERRVIGYSPEQLFSVVAGVDLYEDFVPWCQRSKIIKRNADGSFDAELEIGFKFLVESYVSHVEMQKPKYIKTTASQSGIFDHLINIWEFNPGPVPGTCDLYFFVDFKFQSPLYRQPTYGLGDMMQVDILYKRRLILVGYLRLQTMSKQTGPLREVLELFKMNALTI